MAFSQIGSPHNPLAADARSLNTLKLQAGQNSPAAIKEAAKQFESLFMRELIKSMREATMKSGMLDSPGGDLGSDLLDQQLAVHMSGMPGGLSDMIARQLQQQTTGADTASVPDAPKAAPNPITFAPATPVKTTTGQADFVQRHGAAAAKVERDSGLPPVSCWARLATKPAGAAARSR